MVSKPTSYFSFNNATILINVDIKIKIQYKFILILIIIITVLYFKKQSAGQKNNLKIKGTSIHTDLRSQMT